MSDSDQELSAGSGRRGQARALAVKALEAERRGDQEQADRLFAEADRIDPEAVADVLQEDEAASRQPPPAPAADAAFPIQPVETCDIVLTVNDVTHRLAVDVRMTLLDVLRDRLRLTGTKRGCDLGQCGACTVLLEGRRINACLVLAVMAQGRSITTIEGLARDGAMHPMQEAFIEHDALQCGYCTPGQIMSAIGLLAEGRADSDPAIREYMSGNLCRCGAYANIVAAIRDAAGRV